MDGISVVISLFENEKDLEEIILRVKDDFESFNIPFEILLCDRGSKDQTIINCIKLIRENSINARVIQNGRVNPEVSFNVAIYQASFDYIYFVELNKYIVWNIKEGYKHIKENKEHFVFHHIKNISHKTKDNLPVEINFTDNENFLKIVLQNKIILNLSSFIFDKEFLKKNKITFFEGGYSKLTNTTFIYKVVLNSSNFTMLAFKDTEFGKLCEEKLSNNHDFFEFNGVDALNEVQQMAKLLKKKMVSNYIIDVSIPEYILYCIEKLLEKNKGYFAISKFVKIKGYFNYLKTNKKLSRKTNNKILVWKSFPWMYKV